MKRPSIRVLVGLALAGYAGMRAIKVRQARAALAAGPSMDPPDTANAERHMGETASAEGMPGGD